MKFSKMKICAALLALIMCLGVFVSCGDDGVTVDSVKEDPYGAIMDGSTKYTDALADKYGDIFAVLDKISKGTGTYNVSLEPVGEDAESLLAAADVDMTYVTDSVNGKYSGKMAVGAMGVSTEISLWGDKSNFVLGAPALLGEEKYGLKLDTFEADLKESELFALISGGMSYDEFKAELETQMGISLDDIFSMFSAENFTAGYEQYLKDIEEIVNGFTPEVTEGKYTGVDAITVKYTLTADDIKKLSEAQSKMYENMFGKLLSWYGMDMDDLIGETEDIFTDGVVMSCHLKKDNGMIIGETIAFGDTMTADVSFGADVASKFEMKMVMDMTVEGETANVTMNIGEVTAEGKGGFDVDVAVKAADEEHTIALDIVRDDADGKYEAKFAADGEEMGSAAGTLTYSADEFKFTVDSITAEGETVPMNASVSAKAGGTVEAVPQYNNILDMSQADLQAFAMLFDMMGSMGDEYEVTDEYMDNVIFEEVA